MTTVSAQRPKELPDDATLRAVEETAIHAASEAGKFIAERFGGPMEVMQKAEREGVDIVTDVDKASQKLIASIIEERFPAHTLLGEEDPPDEGAEPPAGDFVWAVDPIDGTKNFVNGSPIHAVSVGVLHRGVPVAGAIWTPWPGERGFTLAHARSGGGAWLDGVKLSLHSDNGDAVPKPGRLTAIPGGFSYVYEVKKPLRGNVGEVRTTGSTCYELLMVAVGSIQYAVSGFANVWDYAAGLVILREAGGLTMTPVRTGGWREIAGWSELSTDDAETLKRLRSWKGAVLSSTPAMAQFVADNLRLRRPGLLKRTWRTVKS